MSIEDYKNDLIRDARCSHCKWIPFAQMKSWRFASGCPSIDKYNFHTWSASGRQIAALALIEGRIGYSDTFVDAIFQCQMCGSCDIACKIVNDREPLEMLREIRAKFVKDGYTPLMHTATIEGLKRDDNMLGKPSADRAKWAEGLDVKDASAGKAEVIYHTGCMFSYDLELQSIARNTISLLKKAGVDVAIMGKREICCGGRAYSMGYQGEFLKYAESNIDSWNNLGAKIVVTSCADGFGTFRELYPRVGKKMNFEILHITELLDRLIKDGKLRFTNKIPMQVTYHDPCNLARGAQVFIPNPGKEHRVLNQLVIRDWQKVVRSNGVYAPPRNIIRNIPGMRLVEMERIEEYTYCCGAGGGVKEAYPDFALWTAKERLEEAKSTGAEALVTACGWCERNFNDAIAESGDSFKVYDIMELIQQAI